MPQTAQQDQGRGGEYRYEIRAPAGLFARLRRIAAANERSTAGEVRRALASHADREEQRLQERER